MECKYQNNCSKWFAKGNLACKNCKDEYIEDDDDGSVENEEFDDDESECDETDDEEEDYDIGSGSTLYTVRVLATGKIPVYADVEVNADSEEEAIRKAKELSEDMDVSDFEDDGEDLNDVEITRFVVIDAF